MLVADGSEFVRPSERLADGRLLRTEVHRRPQHELDAVGTTPLQHLVDDVNRILHVRHEEPLFDHEIVDDISPHRKAGLETEFSEIARTVRVCDVAGSLASADLDAAAVGQPYLFGNVTEHHGAAQRRAERGDQQAMVAARDGARHGPRRVSAESVGDEPLVHDERLRIGFAVRRPRDAANRLGAHAVLRCRGRATGSRCGPGASSVALSPGISHTPLGHISATPVPPYVASSLDHWIVQSRSSGGATSGSAIDARFRSDPRLTMNRRSSA